MMVQGDPNFERRFYVPPTDNYIWKCTGHEDNVESVSWIDPKSNHFLTASLDGTVKMWDCSTGKHVDNVVEGQADGFYCMEALHQGTKILTAAASRPLSG